MKVHALRGCAPEPLAHYLKGLGVLRLVAEQADDGARGFWKDECFHLVTKLDRAELLAFFLERYEPTPLVAPWNKGAGFYRPDDPALGPIENSVGARFERLRRGVRAARDLIEEIAQADAAVRSIKDETKKGNRGERERLRANPDYKARLAQANRAFSAAKEGLIPRCRLTWRGPEREWLDAALVLGHDLKPVFPALLGTGGNDGRLDFTNNYYQRLGEIFQLSDPAGAPNAAARRWFDAALWATPDAGMRTGLAVGQFLPGLAGGANACNSAEGNSRLNPVDFVLMLEGAVLFRGHVTKRLDGRERAQATAPFAVPARAAGYATAATSDEGARGEQWMPLWGAPSTLPEINQLLAEGRARLGSVSVQAPVEFARAVARLGTARGISAFQRFGYIERNGQSNLAVPLGRFVVPDRPSRSISLLDVLDPWLARLRRQSRASNAPARLVSAEQLLLESLFSVSQHPDEPARWQRVLLSLAQVESIMVTGSGFAAGPVPRLDPQWVQAADDGTPELRLAVAFALQHGDGAHGRLDSVRRHWLPLDERDRFATTDKRLAQRTDVVMRGRDGLTDALALVERRVIETARTGNRHIQLRAARGASAELSDLAKLVAGEVDLNRALALARALMAIDLRAWLRAANPVAMPSDRDSWPDDAWLAIRLAMLPWPLDEGRDIGNDPAIFRRLATGDGSAALALARARLLAAGMHCPLSVAVARADVTRLWGAALAFPISKNTARRMARRLDPSATQTEFQS